MVASHAAEFHTDLAKGFIVSGISAGGNIAAVLALRARDDDFFAANPVTGQALQVPFTLHPSAVPEKLVTASLS